MLPSVPPRSVSPFPTLVPAPKLTVGGSAAQWMVTQAQSEAIGLGAATAIIDGTLEMVGPEDAHNESSCAGSGGGGEELLCGSGGGGKLDW